MRGYRARTVGSVSSKGRAPGSSYAAHPVSQSRSVAMYLFHVRMTPMELAAIRATLVVGAASLTALAQRAAQAGQTIIRNPNGLIWRPDTDAGKRLGAGA